MGLWNPPTGYRSSKDPFKYISCYCLSVHALQGYCVYFHSNTSHVIVYHPGSKWNIAKQLVFKYISCYCLSFHIHFYLRFLCIFKYISCYCLSISKFPFSGIKIYSNTSHVIVHPCGTRNERRTKKIQIHLMLLFIQKFVVTNKYNIKFKYISCYCLS